MLLLLVMMNSNGFDVNTHNYVRSDTNGNEDVITDDDENLVSNAEVGINVGARAQYTTKQKMNQTHQVLRTEKVLCNESTLAK